MIAHSKKKSLEKMTIALLKLQIDVEYLHDTYLTSFRQQFRSQTVCLHFLNMVGVTFTIHMYTLYI